MREIASRVWRFVRPILASLVAPLRPHHDVSQRSRIAITIGWIAAMFTAWTYSPYEFIPTPFEVIDAFVVLWTKHGLREELTTSLKLILETVGISFGMALVLAYSNVLAIMRAPVTAVGTLRFLGLTGLSLIFMVIVDGGHPLKVCLLVFGITPFMTKALVREMTASQEELDYARTLRMSEWRVVLEMIVIGKRHRALAVLMEMFAIGWTMLSVVEGMVRSEGGVGVLLRIADKYTHLAPIFAIQLSFFVVGLGADYVFRFVARLISPYAFLETNRRAS